MQDARSTLFTILPNAAKGANDRIRVGIMGVNGRGWAHANSLHACPDAEIAALCDPDAQRLEGRAAEAEQMTGSRPALYPDIRDMLATDTLDAVTIAAPNHWHAPAALMALQAGKHVYVEKPLCHTLEEGVNLVHAAKASGLVVQHGTQRRSDPHWQAVVQEARHGIIGDIYMVRCICFQTRPAVEYPISEAPPPYLNWNLWQGPAEEQAFSRNFVHYNWHWFWRYGNGEVGNNLVHFTDIAHWILGRGFPAEVYGEGGRFGVNDAAETPNAQIQMYQYPDKTMVVNEVRNRFSNAEAGERVNLFLYGSEGYMAGGKFYDKKGQELLRFAPPPPTDATAAHMNAFIQAVRKQKPKEVAATPEDGLVAAGLCHLGNISYRLGRKLDFDAAAMHFTDPDANALLHSVYRPEFDPGKR